MKKIAFIATSYITTSDGISVYLENLYHELLDYKNIYIDLYLSKSSYKAFLEKNPQTKSINIITIDDSSQIKKILQLQTKLMLKNYELIFFPNPMPILFTKSKRIKVIHDLTIKQTPEFFSKKFHLYIDFLINFMKYFDDRIGYISKQTKNDIEKFYNIKKEKLLYLPNGIPKKVQKLQRPTDEEFFQKYKQNTLHFIVVGRINLSKGFDRILKFLSYLENSKLEKSITIDIVGKQTDETKAIFKDKDFKNINLIFHGFVDDKSLNLLYQRSHFCLFLSRNEGFGLPLVETMWLKSVPIISNIPVFSEIVGESYPKFDDKSGYEEAIFEFVKSFLEDKTFQEKIYQDIQKAILLQKDGYKKSAKNLVDYIS